MRFREVVGRSFGVLVLLSLVVFGGFRQSKPAETAKTVNKAPIVLSDKEKSDLSKAFSDVQKAMKDLQDAQQIVQATAQYQAWVAANNALVATKNALTAEKNQISGDGGNRPSDCDLTPDGTTINCPVKTSPLAK